MPENDFVTCELCFYGEAHPATVCADRFAEDAQKYHAEYERKCGAKVPQWSRVRPNAKPVILISGYRALVC